MTYGPAHLDEDEQEALTIRLGVAIADGKVTSLSVAYELGCTEPTVRAWINRKRISYGYQEALNLLLNAKAPGKEATSRKG
jgi:hypothetical protein